MSLYFAHDHEWKFESAARERRFLVVQLNARDVAAAIQGRLKMVLERKDGLQFPDDAECYNVGFDIYAGPDAIVLYFMHPSFDPIDINERPQFVAVTLVREGNS